MLPCMEISLIFRIRNKQQIKVHTKGKICVHQELLCYGGNIFADVYQTYKYLLYGMKAEGFYENESRANYTIQQSSFFR